MPKYKCFDGMPAIRHEAMRSVVKPGMEYMHKKLRWLVIALSCGALGYMLHSLMHEVAGDSREVLGRVEYIELEDYGMHFKSRIDTGAGVSSINAKILTITPAKAENKKDQITFELTDSFGRTKTITTEIVQWARIKKKGANGYIKRPVVHMDILLGGVLIEARVNLADRSGFLYPFLVGRNVIKTGGFLVDPEQVFLKHARHGKKRYM